MHVSTRHPVALSYATWSPFGHPHDTANTSFATCSEGSHRSRGSSGSWSSTHGRVQKLTRLEKLKSLPESLEEGVTSLPLELDLMSYPPAFREELEHEASTILDLTKLQERSTHPLLMRIHETKVNSTHTLLINVPAAEHSLSRTTRNALKLGWPRVSAIKIFNAIETLDEEIDYKIWMPEDYQRYFPNLRVVSFISYNAASGFFREMRHVMDKTRSRDVVFRASQRHINVLGLNPRLMLYMAHANFLLTNLSLTITTEPNYPAYAYTLIRTVLLTDLAAPVNLRLNVDTTDLLYKLTNNSILHFITPNTEDSQGSEDGEPDELPFCKPSVRELSLRFKVIGSLGIPFASRHFPNLRRLALNAYSDVGHPSLENTLYGCMFLERWEHLTRLQLAHINDTLVQLLATSCLQLSELVVFNAATHEELMAKNSFDIHSSLIPLPNMASMRFTLKSLHYLLTKFPNLRVLDLNYPLYVDPMTSQEDLDYSFSTSLAKSIDALSTRYPRSLRYLSIPFIPLTVSGIAGILSAFQCLSTLEVRLASTQRMHKPSRRRLLRNVGRRMKEAMPIQPYELHRRPAAELGSLWVWSDWTSATIALRPVLELFDDTGKYPRVCLPYISGINSQSELETRLIVQYLEKDMPDINVYRFEYNIYDYYD